MGDFIVKYASIILMSGAFGVGTFAFLRLAIKTRAKESEDWRDPPPLIYKLFKPLVRLFASDMRAVMSDSIYSRIQKKLSAGGMNYAILPEEFFTLKFVCMISMLILSGVLFSGNNQLAGEFKGLLILLVPIGYFYPDIWIRDKVSLRRRRVAKEFPFLLDLLVLSMRAGLNYSASLGQAISSLPDGPVKEEFGKLLREMRAGKSRRDALLDLASRMDVKSIHNFVSAINQAEETGGEIVDILTAQAEQRRNERFNEAEASANKAPVKLLLPLVLFLFPIIFMLIGFILLAKLADSGVLPETIAALLIP